jgi:anti-anti-sigma factor
MHVLEGRLDSNTSEALAQQLNNTMDSGQYQLIVDFSQLAYISSAGLRVLLMAVKRVTTESGALILFGMQDHIREVFEISGFLQILTVVGTQLEAEEMIRSFSSN